MAHLFLLLFLLPFPLFAEPASVASYADELVSRAQEMRLADERLWHILLHYMPRWFGGVESEADGKDFFLAKEGKRNPRAELEATLRAFFAPMPADPEEQHPQCLFPARYYWLKGRLGFDPAKLPEQECPRFQAWRAAMDPESITLIFASYYVNNPASMFGHTLLRLDHRGERRTHDLLDYAINYAAVTGNDGGFAFAAKGLLGGYEGKFGSYPYYFQVQKYSNIESRDLWEYHLQLGPEAIERILMHLWELGGTYFNYYFVDENCSYHLLSLLELGDPSLHLRDELGVYVVPSDTLKLVYRKSSLIDGVTYRPSLLSRVRQRRELFTPTEEEFLNDLVDHRRSLEDPHFSSFSPERKALVADAALDFLLYRERHRAEGRTDFHKELMLERSRLPVQPEVPNTPLSGRPEQGHESRRVGLGGGANGDDSFEEFRFRAVYQDLLADDEGYPENSEIETISVRLRYFNEEQKFWVEDAVGVNVVSLVPMDRIVQKPSWNVSFGLETLRAGDCDRCNAIFLRGGSGASFETHLGKREVYYAFLNAYGEISPWSDADYRVGPEGKGGILIDFAKRWKLAVEGKYDYSPLGSPETNYEGRLRQRFNLTKNLELRVEAAKFREGAEALGALQLYY